MRNIRIPQVFTLIPFTLSRELELSKNLSKNKKLAYYILIS